ncbi:MAG: glycoside hydrolase family 99-like domain-containing protein, partial [Verrucomicrobiota bacterium]|nr:glycoside hydrolase family 99-like domain-containing protein [Verrucomicrobiota bacterium]
MRFGLGLLVVFSTLCAAAETRALPAWDFGAVDAKPWPANHCKNVRVEDGVLKGTMTGLDPFITSPAFSLDATAAQAVRMRVKTTAGGTGNLFWVREGETIPQGKFNVPVTWIGDGEWHTYRIEPYWQGEKKIARVRIDFAVPQEEGATFEMAWVQVVDPGAGTAGAPSVPALEAWTTTDDAATSPPLKIPADDAFIVAVELAATEGDEGCIQWATDAVSGLHRKTFRLKPDGRPHTYNVDVGGDKNWRGNIVLLKVSPANIRSVAVTDEPQGGADVSVVQARMADALNRAGRAFPLLLQFANSGGADARDVTLAVKALPRGVRVAPGSGWERVPEIPAMGLYTHRLPLEADEAVSGDAVFAVSGGGADGQTVTARIEVLPDLKLPRAAYVPEPKPVKSGYEIGALYYPGWASIDSWAHIWPVAPERKPVLGWYDEANPEVVDWQIKWSVENGLSYWLVDWYWDRGRQHNDHWIKAFKQARYRSQLKWAVMWANHNAEGSHSEEDQRAVTKFWIENYFNMPEYYRIDGKPVVMIWSAQNMERDLGGGGGGCKRLLELSRRLATEAGYGGIYFIAMKWPEASWESKVVQGYKDMGFDMTSIYHYMHHGGQAADPRRFPFDLVADSNAAQWAGLHETGILPFLPNLSTGWDDRPWHGDRGTEIYGRTVAQFQRICRDAKRFADATGVKRLTLGPLNEWGEGSYAEPNAEFGFGIYEAVRETFCEMPATGWPLNYGPRDVGLGPYDLPPP